MSNAPKQFLSSPQGLCTNFRPTNDINYLSFCGKIRRHRQRRYQIKPGSSLCIKFKNSLKFKRIRFCLFLVLLAIWLSGFAHTQNEMINSYVRYSVQRWKICECVSVEVENSRFKYSVFFCCCCCIFSLFCLNAKTHRTNVQFWLLDQNPIGVCSLFPLFCHCCWYVTLDAAATQFTT